MAVKYKSKYDLRSWLLMFSMSLCHCYLTVNGAVLQPARRHAKPEGPVGAEDKDDRGQHSAAAGWAASDPGGAPKSPGTECAGETEELNAVSWRWDDALLFDYFLGIFCCNSFRRSQNLYCVFQMFLQKGTGGLSLSSVQMAQGNAVQQAGTLGIQGQVVSAGPLQSSMQQQRTVQTQPQQQTLLREQNPAHSQVRKTEHLSFIQHM